MFRGLAPVAAVGSARSRAILALGLVALAITGCSTSAASGSKTSTVSASGSPLTLWISDPPAVKANRALQDVVNGEVVAWSQHKAAAGVAIKLHVADGSPSENARDAIHDASAIAYMGEIQTGQSTQTVGITNALGLLEFSPTDDVQPVKNDFESINSYGRTFASLPLQLTTSTAALNKAAPSNFASGFKTDIRHAPNADAITGYDAVWVLMRVLGAEKAQDTNRGAVAGAVIATLKANQGQASVPAFKIALK